MTYNGEYEHAGYFTFSHYRDVTGELKTEEGMFQTIYPTSYDQ